MVYKEYDKIVVGTKSPQYKIPKKYKTWSICVFTVMVYIEYGTGGPRLVRIYLVQSPV